LVFGQELVVTQDHRLFLLAYRLIEPDGAERADKIILSLYAVNATPLFRSVQN